MLLKQKPCKVLSTLRKKRNQPRRRSRWQRRKVRKPSTDGRSKSGGRAQVNPAVKLGKFTLHPRRYLSCPRQKKGVASWLKQHARRERQPSRASSTPNTDYTEVRRGDQWLGQNHPKENDSSRLSRTEKLDGKRKFHTVKLVKPRAVGTGYDLEQRKVIRTAPDHWASKRK
jgi:hypothetical protein